jgi:hypothetical protein
VRADRTRNTDGVRDVVAKRIEDTDGQISAKRLLPEARAAGYVGSARNFRRLVAAAKANWRSEHRRGRRPGMWSPGETLIVERGSVCPLQVFCAQLAWSRVRFVRFALDERAQTTFAVLAECFRGDRRGAEGDACGSDGELKPKLRLRSSKLGSLTRDNGPVGWRR